MVRQKDTYYIIHLISLDQLYISLTVVKYTLVSLMVRIDKFSSHTSDIFVTTFETRYEALINETKYTFRNFQRCSTR
jgi:hypothetical protein